VVESVKIVIPAVSCSAKWQHVAERRRPLLGDAIMAQPVELVREIGPSLDGSSAMWWRESPARLA